MISLLESQRVLTGRGRNYFVDVRIGRKPDIRIAGLRQRGLRHCGRKDELSTFVTC